MPLMNTCDGCGDGIVTNDVNANLCEECERKTMKELEAAFARRGELPEHLDVDKFFSKPDATVSVGKDVLEELAQEDEILFGATPETSGVCHLCGAELLLTDGGGGSYCPNDCQLY